MLSIGIGEIQKNTSVFTNMTEAIQIIDKRKKQVLTMVYLLDTNIIIRFLVGDHEEHLEKSTEYFEQIELGSMEVEILSGVLMEAFFVLTKFYKLPKIEVISDLKTILSFEGVVNKDKVILFETLSIIE